VWAA